MPNLPFRGDSGWSGDIVFLGKPDLGKFWDSQWSQ